MSQTATVAAKLYNLLYTYLVTGFRIIKSHLLTVVYIVHTYTTNFYIVMFIKGI